MFYSLIANKPPPPLCVCSIRPDLKGQEGSELSVICLRRLGSRSGVEEATDRNDSDALTPQLLRVQKTRKRRQRHAASPLHGHAAVPNRFEKQGVTANVE